MHDEQEWWELELIVMEDADDEDRGPSGVFADYTGPEK